MFDAEGPLAPALLAFAPYDDRYSHIVNRCGRRLATNFILNGSTSSIWYGVLLGVQSNIRDAYTQRIPTNSGFNGSSHYALRDGNSLFRTAGIVQ